MVDDQIDWLDEEENLDADFNYLKRCHVTSGYRDGRSAGHEYILQEAFNEGFKDGSRSLQQISRYRGVFTGILMFLMKKGCPAEILVEMENVMSFLEQRETEFVLPQMLENDEKVAGAEKGDAGQFYEIKNSNTEDDSLAMTEQLHKLDMHKANGIETDLCESMEVAAYRPEPESSNCNLVTSNIVSNEKLNGIEYLKKLKENVDNERAICKEYILDFLNNALRKYLDENVMLELNNLINNQ